MNLYELSTPILQHYLQQLDGMLVKAQLHQELSREDLLNSSIASDMRPLWQQVLIALGFSMRATAPLAGLSTPQLDFKEKNFNQLREDLSFALNFLNQLTREQFNGSGNRQIIHQAGLAQQKNDGSNLSTAFCTAQFFLSFDMCLHNFASTGCYVGES